MQTPPNFQSNYFTPFGSAGGSAAAFGQQGRARSPFLPGGFPGLTGSGMGLGSYMEGMGFRQHRGGWTRPINMGSRAPGGNSRERWSQEYAQQQFAMNGGQPNLADQAMLAAKSDYDQLSDILGEQNRDRSEYQNDLIAQQNRLEQDRLASIEGIMGQTEAGARQIEESGQKSFDRFTEYRDQTVKAMEGYANQIKAMAQGVVDSYDSEALGSISAGAAGIARSTQAQVKQIEAQARAQGMSDDMVASMTFQAKGAGLQQMQSAIAPMIDQKNQIRAQLGMQATGMYAGALAQAGQVRGQAMGLTAEMSDRMAQSSQQAAQYRMMGQIQAVQANATFHNAQIALGEQRAMALRDLTQKFPSAFDTVLQGAYSATQFGGRSPINFDALGAA